MDAATVDWLAGPGRTIADAVDPRTDPLIGIPTLRRHHPDVDEHLLTAAWTLALVRDRHAERLGPRAAHVVLTDELAQQASRYEAALYRASRLAADGVGTILDGTCGAGLDAAAALERGMSVWAVDVDPVAYACTRVNLQSGRAEGRCLGVVQADITSFDRPDVDALFVDPARRTADGPRRVPGRAPAERDPHRWLPPWSWVVDVQRSVRTVAKCAPGIPPALVPPDAEIEWLAVGRDLVEATVWFGAGALRRATVLTRDGRVLTRTGPRDPRRTGSVSAAPGGAGVPGRAEWLLEPHDALRRADLIDDLAAEVGAVRVHPGSAWLSSREAVHSDWVTCWKVERWVDLADLRAELHGSGPPTFKTADAGRSAESVRRQVGHRPTPGQPGRTVVVVRESRQTAVVTRDE